MSQPLEMLNQGAARVRPLPQDESRAARENGAVGSRVNRSGATDEIARLVQRLFLSSSPGEERKTIVFCGVNPGSGCSWVCAKAAELLAGQIPGRVCVIDANLRSPSLHEYFHVEVGVGFADAMRQPGPINDFVRSTSTNHLWLMTSGAVGQAPNGALNTARLQARFAELRGEFDFLLVDVPAISLFGDALLLGQLSDGIVLVIASNSTRREPARAAKQILQDANVLILGAVLNKRTYPIPEAVYRRL
jgi:protein-tyrosine kinase